MRRLLLATTALLALTGAARADTFTVAAGGISQPNGAENITFTLGTLTRTVSAGEIQLHQNIPAVDLLVWCLDIRDTLFSPYTYNMQTYTAGSNLPGLPAGGLDASQLRQIASLMYGGLTDMVGPNTVHNDAATQLAIWSVEYGSGITYSGLSGGLSGRLAALLIDSANGGLIDCPNCSLTILSDAIEAPNQALGFASVPVPGPVMGAGLPGLVTACLGLLGFARRRRNKTA